MWRAGISGPTAAAPWHVFTSKFPLPLKRQHKVWLGLPCSQETSGNQPHDNTVCCLFPASELFAWMGWGQAVHIAAAQAASIPCLFSTFSVLCSPSFPCFWGGSSYNWFFLHFNQKAWVWLSKLTSFLILTSKFIGKLPSKLLPMLSAMNSTEHKI